MPEQNDLLKALLKQIPKPAVPKASAQQSKDREAQADKGRKAFQETITGRKQSDAQYQAGKKASASRMVSEAQFRKKNNVSTDQSSELIKLRAQYPKELHGLIDSALYIRQKGITPISGGEPGKTWLDKPDIDYVKEAMKSPEGRASLEREVRRFKAERGIMSAQYNSGEAKMQRDWSGQMLAGIERDNENITKFLGLDTPVVKAINDYALAVNPATGPLFGLGQMFPATKDMMGNLVKSTPSMVLTGGPQVVGDAGRLLFGVQNPEIAPIPALAQSGANLGMALVPELGPAAMRGISRVAQQQAMKQAEMAAVRAATANAALDKMAGRTINGFAVEGAPRPPFNQITQAVEAPVRPIMSQGPGLTVRTDSPDFLTRQASKAASQASEIARLEAARTARMAPAPVVPEVPVAPVAKPIKQFKPKAEKGYPKGETPNLVGMAEARVSKVVEPAPTGRDSYSRNVDRIPPQFRIRQSYKGGVIEHTREMSPGVWEIDTRMSDGSTVTHSGISSPQPPVKAAKVETPAPVVEKGGKQPWEMTYKDLVKVVERGNLGQRRPILEQMFSEWIGPKSEFAANDFERGVWTEYNEYADRPEMAHGVRLPYIDMSAKHKAVIQQALAGGKPVPAQVLADYPDLAAKYGKGAPKPVARPTESPTIYNLSDEQLRQKYTPDINEDTLSFQVKTSTLEDLIKSRAKKDGLEEQLADFLQLRSGEISQAEFDARNLKRSIIETPKAGIAPEPTNPEVAQFHEAANRPPTAEEIKYYRNGKFDKNGMTPAMRSYVAKEIETRYPSKFNAEDLTDFVIDVPGDGTFTINHPAVPGFYKEITNDNLRFKIGSTPGVYNPKSKLPHGMMEESFPAETSSFKIVSGSGTKAVKGHILPDRPEFMGRPVGYVDGVFYDAQSGYRMFDRTATSLDDAADKAADMLAKHKEKQGVDFQQVAGEKPVINKAIKPPKPQITDRVPLPENGVVPDYKPTPRSKPTAKPFRGSGKDFSGSTESLVRAYGGDAKAAYASNRRFLDAAKQGSDYSAEQIESMERSLDGLIDADPRVQAEISTNYDYYSRRNVTRESSNYASVRASIEAEYEAAAKSGYRAAPSTPKPAQEVPKVAAPKVESPKVDAPATETFRLVNMESLSRGAGAKYIVGIRGENGDLIAKRWARSADAKLAQGEVIVDLNGKTILNDANGPKAAVKSTPKPSTVPDFRPHRDGFSYKISRDYTGDWIVERQKGGVSYGQKRVYGSDADKLPSNPKAEANPDGFNTFEKQIINASKDAKYVDKVERAARNKSKTPLWVDSDGNVIQGYNPNNSNYRLSTLDPLNEAARSIKNKQGARMPNAEPRWPRTPSDVQGKDIYVYGRNAQGKISKPIAGPFYTHQDAKAASVEIRKRLGSQDLQFDGFSYGAVDAGSKVDPIFPDIKSTGENPFKSKPTPTKPPTPPQSAPKPTEPVRAPQVKETPAVKGGESGQGAVTRPEAPDDMVGVRGYVRQDGKEIRGYIRTLPSEAGAEPMKVSAPKSPPRPESSLPPKTNYSKPQPRPEKPWWKDDKRPLYKREPSEANPEELIRVLSDDSLRDVRIREIRYKNRYGAQLAEEWRTKLPADIAEKLAKSKKYEFSGGHGGNPGAKERAIAESFLRPIYEKAGKEGKRVHPEAAALFPDLAKKYGWDAEGHTPNWWYPNFKDTPAGKPYNLEKNLATPKKVTVHEARPLTEWTDSEKRTLYGSYATFIEGSLDGIPIVSKTKGMAPKMSKKTVAALEDAVNDPALRQMMNDAGIKYIQLEPHKTPQSSRTWTMGMLNDGGMVIHSRTADAILASTTRPTARGFKGVIAHEAGHAYWNNATKAQKDAFEAAVKPIMKDLEEEIGKYLNLKPSANSFEYNPHNTKLSEIHAELQSIKFFDPQKYKSLPKEVTAIVDEIAGFKKPEYPKWNIKEQNLARIQELEAKPKKNIKGKQAGMANITPDDIELAARKALHAVYTAGEHLHTQIIKIGKELGLSPKQRAKALEMAKGFDPELGKFHFEPKTATTEKQIAAQPMPESSSREVTGFARQVSGREAMPGVSREQILKTGQEAINSGRVHPETVAERVLSSGKVASPEETAAMAVRSRELANEFDAVGKAIEQEKDPIELFKLSQRQDEILNALESIDTAGRLTGNTWSKMGQALQIALKQDYSLATLLTRVKAYAGEVTGAHKAELARLTTLVEQGNVKIDELKNQIATMAASWKTKTPRAKAAKVLASYFGVSAEKAPLISGGIRGKQAGMANYAIPKEEMAAMKAARSLAREAYHDEGIKTLDGVLDFIRKESNIPEATDEELLRLISEPYRIHMLEADIARRKIDQFMRDVKKQAIEKQKPKMARVMGAVWDTYDAVSRSLQAGGDMSAPFIQGRKGLFANPKSWIEAWGPAMKALWSKGDDVVERYMLENVERHPMYARSVAAGLDLPEIGGKLTNQEEAFASNLIHVLKDKKLGGGQLYFKFLANTDAAYTVFLNKLRFDTFVKMAKAAPDSPEALRDFANAVNIIYGRGKEGWAVNLAKTDVMRRSFFAPRFTVSKWQYANPVGLATNFKTPQGRAAMLKVYGAQAAAYTGLVAMARMAGWEVGVDPRSSDFGKVTLPNGFKMDLFGKEAEAYKLVSQILYGKVSQTGGFDPKSVYNAYQVSTQYLANKAAPLPRDAMNLAFGKFDFKEGKTRAVEPRDFGMSKLPFWIQQAIDDGTFQSAPYLVPISAMGIDIQGPGKPKTKTPPPFNPLDFRLGPNPPKPKAEKKEKKSTPTAIDTAYLLGK